jgi:syntaxin 16
MATRDLFTIFSQARDNYNPHRRPSPTHGAVQIATTDSDTLLEPEDLESGSRGQEAPPPIWMKIVDGVNAQIAQLEAEVRQLAKAHEEQLRPGGEGFFDNVNDGDTKVERLNNNISKLFHKCNDQVKMLSNPQLGNDADLKIRKQVQIALAGKLQRLSTQFRKKHKHYLQKVQERKRKTDDLDDSWKFAADDDDDDDGGQSWSEQQMQEIDLMGEMIDERDKEIQKIVTAISELSAIFRELSVLVIDSGTILDRIDYNMEHVVENFESAEIELEQAIKYKKQSPATYCIVVLCLLNIAMVVIMIIKQLAQNDSSSPAPAPAPATFMPTLMPTMLPPGV